MSFHEPGGKGESMNKLLHQLGEALRATPSFDPADNVKRQNYDPEMIYVECRACGRPILWEPGQTTALLARSNIKPGMVDERCLILSDGCQECMPYSDGFSLSIVRLAVITQHDLILMQKPGGNA